jgi:hypothetical protein
MKIQTAVLKSNTTAKSVEIFVLLLKFLTSDYSTVLYIVGNDSGLNFKPRFYSAFILFYHSKASHKNDQRNNFHIASLLQ